MSTPVFVERQETIDTLRELIGGMSVGMLTTVAQDGKLRSRPMIPARHEFDATSGFLCSPRLLLLQR